MSLERIYERRFAGISQETRTAVWNELGPWLFRFLGSPGKVLDLAAGRCEFINAVPAVDRWALDQMDISAYAAPGVHVVTGQIQTAPLPEAAFDAVFMSNFLEHLPTVAAVQEILAIVKRSLKPGGVVGIMGPNFKHCSRVYFDCADHVLALTDVSVAEHLYAAGFEIDSCVERFLPFSFRSAFPAHPLLTRLYLNLPLAWRFVGKQFLLKGRLPAT